MPPTRRREAIRAGVSHATHLFNRMSPLGHRAPGATGAILASGSVAAEIICDGFHVHPTVVAVALAAKGAERILAITDGTAASGLPPGARATLGGRPIVVRPGHAELEDGTLAGSVVTMNRVFRMLVSDAGVPIETAARVCATSPAGQLGLAGRGRLEPGADADFVVMSSTLDVVRTWIAGRPVGEP
ncbi:MAG: amidohydrolase family protein [Vicinamibacterales bacterium]